MHSARSRRVRPVRSLTKASKWRVCCGSGNVPFPDTVNTTTVTSRAALEWSRDHDEFSGPQGRGGHRPTRSPTASAPPLRRRGRTPDRPATLRSGSRCGRSLPARKPGPVPRCRHPVLRQLGAERFETGPRLARGGVPDHQHQPTHLRGVPEPGTDQLVLVPGNLRGNRVTGIVGACPVCTRRQSVPLTGQRPAASGKDLEDTRGRYCRPW